MVGNVVGWTRPADSTLTVVTYARATGGFPTLFGPGAPDRGAQFFAGGPGSASSSAEQRIDLASAIEASATWLVAIDQGRAVARLSGYLGGFAGQNDGVTLTATFLDAQQQPLGALSIGPVADAERDSLTGMWLRQTDADVPPGTRQVLLHLEFTRTDGAYDDGYADSLSFSIEVVGLYQRRGRARPRVRPFSERPW